MTTVEEIKNRRDVPVILANHQGFITYINEPFSKVFGWDAQEIIGQTLSIIIPPGLHDAHQLGFSRFLATNKPTLLNQPLRLKAVKKDGTEFEAEHFIIAEQYQGQWIFAATIRPLADL